MKLVFNSISYFRNSIENLLKKERDGYGSCKKDICKKFSSKSFDEIWEMNFKIRDLSDVKLIKVRIANSFLNSSSADGFRLILLCNKKYQSVTFLNIYPKRGKYAKLDQTKAEYKIFLNQYLEELKSATLKVHDINNTLSEIEKI